MDQYLNWLERRAPSICRVNKKNQNLFHHFYTVADYSLYFEMNALFVLLSNLKKIYCSSPPKNVTTLFINIRSTVFMNNNEKKKLLKGYQRWTDEINSQPFGRTKNTTGNWKRLWENIRSEWVVFWFWCSCHLKDAFLGSKRLLDTDYTLRSHLWWIFLY